MSSSFGNERQGPRSCPHLFAIKRKRQSEELFMTISDRSAAAASRSTDYKDGIRRTARQFAGLMSYICVRSYAAAALVWEVGRSGFGGSSRQSPPQDPPGGRLRYTAWLLEFNGE
jgi:hypothetical protein